MNHIFLWLRLMIRDPFLRIVNRIGYVDYLSVFGGLDLVLGLENHHESSEELRLDESVYALKGASKNATGDDF